MLIGEREFKLMKPSAFFINTGRGRLVDEPPVTHGTRVPREFYKMDNVVLTPHNGGATWESRTRATLNSALALVDFINRHAAVPA